MGRSKTVTLKGRCKVHESREIKDWFYPAFSEHLRPGDEAGAREFAAMLDSPLRVILEVTPEKFISYDGSKMFRHAAGKLDASELAPPLESDGKRLARERQRRGI